LAAAITFYFGVNSSPRKLVIADLLISPLSNLTRLQPVNILMKPHVSHERANSRRRRAEREWKRLCDKYLPLRPKRSIWWYNRIRTRKDPAQGWKLHVSATILSAVGTFRSVAPYLTRRKISFKAIKSLADLGELNSGVYGFSQVGKFITIYPPSNEVAVSIADDLARLTANRPGPVVPYDERLCGNSCVYYRYGAFALNRKVALRGKRVCAIARPDGKLLPDRREPGTAAPQWLEDPFVGIRLQPRIEKLTPLETRYGNYKALAQRGRGGVYRAFDLSGKRKKLCVIKEGRPHGEVG